MEHAKHVVKNLKFTAVSELTLAVLKFLSRRVFVLLLGKEYLGINGLFTDILSMLSLAELGFGVSITYSLYQPVAKGDEELIKSLMALYGRFYRAVGMVVLAAGLCLLPFLDFFVKEMPEHIPHISLIYILNVANVSVSYFCSYKSTLLFVCQKKYVDSLIRAAAGLLATAAQIGVLLLTGNYLCYLCIAILSTILQNGAVSAAADNLYPYLKRGKEKGRGQIQPVPANILADIRRNVSAMILHRVGSVAVFGTDNVLISKFVGIGITGLYSNYIMIRNFLNVITNTVFNAITPAMGNLNVTGTVEEKRRTFSRLNFFAAWLFGWMSICLLWLYDPFITLWLGEGFLLPRPVVALIVANFYLNSMRVPVANTKSIMGLFWDERYKSVLEAFMNLAVSVALARRWGISGILLGTFISTASLPFWIEPLGLYRHGLKEPVRRYFSRYFCYLSVTAAAGAITGLLCSLAQGSVFGFFLKLFFCTVIPNSIYLAVYGRMEEFRFMKSLVHCRNNGE
ncbi:MAG: hypothetical protein HFG73_01080 [Hungatella sp.]|nr:hypothetical protein [Hungatella sp.]